MRFGGDSRRERIFIQFASGRAEGSDHSGDLDRLRSEKAEGKDLKLPIDWDSNLEGLRGRTGRVSVSPRRQRQWCLRHNRTFG